MYNHVANCGRKALLKQIFSVFLIFTFYFNSLNSAFAGNGLFPWSLSNPVIQGASTVYTGTKEVVLNGVKKIATGTAKITPVATDVAKLLGKGVGGLALSVAVEQLLGAVDWVLDAENNQIVYKEKPDLKKPWIPKVWAYNSDLSIGLYTTADDACNAMLKYSSSMYPSYEVVNYATYMNSNNVTATCYLYNKYGLIKDLYTLSYIDNPYYDPKAEEKDDKKTLPLEAAAQQIISNAQAGDPIAQAVTSSAASQIVSDAEQDNVKARPIINQLENTQSIPTNQTANGDAVPKDTTGTGNPPTTSAPPQDLKLDFPIFCDWAPSICQAAKEVIALPITLTNWWDTSTKSITESWTWTKERYQAALTSITDFFKNEPDKSDSDNDLPVQDIPLPELNTGTFKATAGCPAPIPIAITIGTKGTGQISYEPICQFASKWSFVAPLIGFLSAAMILVGVGRKGEDSEI